MPRKAASADDMHEDLLQALSDDKLSATAGDAVFKRGQSYFEQDRVKLVKSSGVDAHTGSEVKSSRCE